MNWSETKPEMKQEENKNLDVIDMAPSTGINTDLSTMRDMSLSEVMNLIDIKYDEVNDVIVVDCASNLMITAMNNLFVSKEETIIISEKGNIHLNPLKD